MTPFFEIAGISIPLKANLDFEQDYSDVGSYFDKRKVNGSGLRLNSTIATKIKTELRGKGWQPAGLNGLDLSGSVLLKCGAPKSISNTGQVIILPSERRTDAGYEPYGYGIVDGERVATGFDSVVTDTYTLTSVAGAVFYELEYFPEITVLAKLARTTSDISKANYGWTITAEQV